MSQKPLAIDLYCGLGGWTEGLLAEGYDVIGFDIEAHEYGEERYPGKLVLQDVLTLHGSQFKDAALIVASPPCQEYSYMAMPWQLAKAKAAAIRADDTGAELDRLNRLFNACFRLQREAGEAAGRHIPMVVENVRGAQPWVGRAAWNFGSYYLWGDVPALMPQTLKAVKVPGVGAGWKHPDDPRHQPGLAFNPGAQGAQGARVRELLAQNDGRKNPSFRFDGSGRSFQSESVSRHVDGLKGAGDGWFNDAKRKGGAETGHLSRTGSKSPARKAAAARIAKIPLPLSSWIARTYKPAAPSARAA